MTLRWPIVQFPYVLHVGELDAALKGKTGHASSYEGSGLSVSRHPKEWEQIARLGGSPTWKIKHASGGISLLDAHALDQRLRQEIAQWAGDQGLCAEGTVFKLWREDEEGEQRFSLYASQAEARVELGGCSTARMRPPDSKPFGACFPHRSWNSEWAFG